MPTQKSVAARLVDSENLSKKYIYFFLKKQHAQTKSVARLVDSENWSNLVFFTKKTQKTTTIHAHKKCSRSVDSENL